MTRARSALLALVAPLAIACAPKARPLAGAPAPAVLPRTEVAPGHSRIVFRWAFAEGGFEAKGEGVARIASPDSVRLDFFMGGALGGTSTAFLIGDSLETPGNDSFRRLIPPVPLLWASLGRLRLPPAADTTARVDADTLRADIGRDPRWRVTFAGGRLVRIERIHGGRVRETLVRGANDDVSYANRDAHRSLKLTVTKHEQVADFERDIWRR